MSLCLVKLQINPARSRSAVLGDNQTCFFPCAAGRSGRWESGNPDFGFPLFHGPHIGPGFGLVGRKRAVAEAVGMWKSPPLRLPSVRGNGGKPAIWLSTVSTTRHFHGPSITRLTSNQPFSQDSTHRFCYKALLPWVPLASPKGDR